MSSINGDRLKNAIVFFAKHTEACGKIKLFKLLYLLDFEHFKQTGKSVTGLNYEAWQFGPVPTELNNVWSDLKRGKATAIEIVCEQQYDHVRESVKVRPGIEFDDENFTPRQLKILEMLSEKYLSNMSQSMVKVTHEPGGPWDKVWEGGKGDHKQIPYELSIPEEDPDRRLILESALEARRIAVHSAEGGY